MVEAEQEEKPSYYAIITADVRYDERLAPMEKILYGEFTCLTNKYGFSTASNNYFVKLYNCGASSVSRWIKHLEECGHISVEYEREGKQILRRIVRVKHPFSSPKTEGYSKNDSRVFQKREGGIPKNAKRIIQEENNTSDNITSISSEEENHNLLSPQREVIGWYYECWNEMFKKGAVASEKPFLNGQQAARLIQGHIKNGLSVSQIKTAIKNAMEDSWLVSQGYSLSIILSASQMNKLLNAKQKVSFPTWANKRPALANQVTEEDINF